MKSYMQKLKLAGIILIPYVPLLISYILYQWSMSVQTSSNINVLFYDVFQRIQFLLNLLLGALFALWFYLVYDNKRKATVITILVNLCVMICLIAYTLLQPTQQIDSIDLFYHLLSQQQGNFLTYCGMHIFALIFLFLTKADFQNEKHPSITDNIIENDSSQLDENIIIPQKEENLTKSNSSLFEHKKQKEKVVDSIENDDPWKPKGA